MVKNMDFGILMSGIEFHLYHLLCIILGQMLNTAKVSVNGKMEVPTY